MAFSGGSVSASLIACEMYGNTAWGLGGGALFLNQSTFSTLNSSIRNNIAPNGGGGAYLQQGISTTPVCGQGNTASYGSCVATPYTHLLVHGIPVTDSPAYPGIMFSVTVYKKDAYNQTIVSDSSSVIQIYTSLNKTAQADPYVGVLGSTIAVFDKGIATFQIQIKPSFSQVLCDSGVTVFQTDPYIYFKGLDSQDLTTTMRTPIFPVIFSEGPNICPQGFFLNLDSPQSHKGAATCSDCLAGQCSVFAAICGCAPAYFLQSPSSCQICPPNFYCPGGTSGGSPCPGNSFSQAGANSSSECTQYAVSIIVRLPILLVNFTSVLQAAFVRAVASAAGVSPKRVSILSTASVATRRAGLALVQISHQMLANRTSATEMSTTRLDAVELTADHDLDLSLRRMMPFREPLGRRAANLQLQVDSEIAADNSAAAHSISQQVDQNSLNKNFIAQGLPEISSVSVSVTDARTQTSSEADSLPYVLGGSVGGLIFLLITSVVGYFFFKLLKHHREHSRFLEAMREAEADQTASTDLLPPDDVKGSSGLRMQYTADLVLGKGTSCCVVKATKKGTENNKDDITMKETADAVAIKIIIPRKRVFDEMERERLKRETEALQAIMHKKCRSIVLVQTTESVQRLDVCWFIMEVLGQQAALAKPVDDTKCMQLARDVLAALKVLHDERWVHGDVTPANILLSRATQEDGYKYKLIDFGSVLRINKAHQGADGQLTTEALATATVNVTGEPAYRAPEMFCQPCLISAAVDLWSLGISMFELLTARLPFSAGTYSVITENSLHGLLQQSCDPNLEKAIEKALEVNLANR